MPKLPLYKPGQSASLLASTPTNTSYTTTCTRCNRYSTTKAIAIDPVAVRVGNLPDENRVLVLSDRPTRQVDATHRAYSEGAQYALASLFKESGVSGTYLLDYAVRCFGDAAPIEEGHIKACAPATTVTFRSFRPTRILAMGKTAINAITSRNIDPFDVRRGWSTAIDSDYVELFGVDESCPIVPVYFMPDFVSVANNRFLRAEFASDLRHALTRPLPNKRELAHVYGNLSYTLVSSPMEAAIAKRACEASGILAFDTETTGQMFDDEFRVCSISFATDDEEVFVFDGIDTITAYLSVIKEILACATPKVGHNVKYDVLACMSDPRIKTAPTNASIDTRLLRKLVEPTVNGKLDVCSELVGLGGHKAEAKAHLSEINRELNAICKFVPGATTPSGAPKSPPKLTHLNLSDVSDRTKYLVSNGVDVDSFSYGYMNADIRARYNARDTYTTLRLHSEARRRETPQSRYVYEKITQPALKALGRIESWGIPVDIDRVHKNVAFLQAELALASNRLATYGDVNWNSPKQIGELIYNKLGLPVLDRTASGAPGTGSEVMAELAKRGHQVAKDIVSYRRLTKLDGTYVTGLLPHIRVDGRVYPSFLLDGAESGRISSQNPNAQNIPSAERDPVFGTMIRSMFRPKKGRVFLEGDMSQQELRVLAMLSQDPVLIDAFKTKGTDIHKATAAVIYNVPLDNVTKEQRTRSKTVTFGLIYGKTDFGLAQQLLITEEEAVMIRKSVLGRYKRADTYMRETVEYANKHGGVWTLWAGEKARWRPLPDVGLLGDDKGVRGRRFNATNASINTPIQGLAADFVTASLWPIVEVVLNYYPTAKVICTVHDSIMIECDEADAPYIAHEMKIIMEGHPSMGVPLEAEFKVGESWGEMSPLMV